MTKYYNGPVCLHYLISYPVDASWYLGMWLDLTTSHRQTWLFSSTSTYHSTDLLTARGVAHLVVHRTSGSTSYETIPRVRLEASGDVLSTVDMVVQRRDGPRWLRELDDDDDDDDDDDETPQEDVNAPYRDTLPSVIADICRVHSSVVTVVFVLAAVQVSSWCCREQTRSLRGGA